MRVCVYGHSSPGLRKVLISALSNLYFDAVGDLIMTCPAWQRGAVLQSLLSVTISVCFRHMTKSAEWKPSSYRALLYFNTFFFVGVFLCVCWGENQAACLWRRRVNPGRINQRHIYVYFKYYLSNVMDFPTLSSPLDKEISFVGLLLKCHTVGMYLLLFMSTQDIIAFDIGQFLRCLTTRQMMPVQRDISLQVTENHTDTNSTLRNVTLARLAYRRWWSCTTDDWCSVSAPRIARHRHLLVHADPVNKQIFKCINIPF